LTPYADRTAPEVVAVTPVRARHRVVFVAEATDMPSLPVPGRWSGFPVTPALLSWQIMDAFGREVVPDHVARDVRNRVPANDLFWTTFARGTHQNWPVFAGCKQRGLTGRYLFKLRLKPVDTPQLRDGVYVLVITAQDITGNKSVRRLRFTVQNDANWR
jgi:hypothetical protein